MNVLSQQLQTVHVTLLALLLSCADLCQCLLCSRCESTTDRYPGRCKDNPPSPSSCMKSAKKLKNQYCIKAEEYIPKGNSSSSEWQLTNLYRDCTYLPKLPSKPCLISRVQNGGKLTHKKICSYFCQSDGCNHSNTYSSSAHLVLPISLLLVLSLTNRSNLGLSNLISV